MVTVPMGPAVLDLTDVRAGDRNLLHLTLLAKGNPVDLTGLELSAQARSKAVDPDPAALTAVIEVVDPVAGTFTLAWPGDDVTTVLAGKATWKGVWDLQVDDVTVVAGTITAAMDVTR